MPIFEYHCDDCGRDFEALVSPGEQVSECKHCRSEHIRRRFSSFSTRTDTYTSSNRDSAITSSCASCNSGHCSTCHH